MNEDDLCYRSAVELAADVAARRLSPVEIVETFLRRIERLNPTLNAYCTPAPERALAAARQAEATVMRGEPLGRLRRGRRAASGT